MQRIIILDCGSQYTQLIARKIREANVFCEIFPYNKIPQIENDIKGFIISGSPYSVNNPQSPKINLDNIKGVLPLLGICYGAQYLVNTYGGKVESAATREYGRANLNNIDTMSLLLKGVSLGSQVWMSHGDTIVDMPKNYKTICSTSSVQNAGYHIEGENTFGLQFHPEVYHSKEGIKILTNFVKDICGCDCSFTPKSFVTTTIESLKQKLSDDKVVLALSGGVDSTVAAVLLHKAIGDRLHCVFVNNGLLRKNEYSSVLNSYQTMGLNIQGIDAKDRFYKALQNIVQPEQKRKIIGKLFIDVFNEEAQKIQDVKWLGQGTIYPDVIESSSVNGPSQTIKSHHNVGGLPKDMHLQLVEPLRYLFKDEVRKVGKELGIDPLLLSRHPFPGPGLAIRILGEITQQRVAILQEVDDIYIQGLRDWDLYNKVWQAGAILLNIQSVGVMGDERTYENVVALRAVESVDGMTADWCKLPYEFLAEISSKIINSVKGVNRVCYDISSKPPATIEWE